MESFNIFIKKLLIIIIIIIITSNMRIQQMKLKKKNF